MTHRQILRQLAEAWRLHLQDFDDAALVHLLRDELVTVAGQTVTLTEKGRRRVAPKKTTTKGGKPLLTTSDRVVPPQRGQRVQWLGDLGGRLFWGDTAATLLGQDHSLPGYGDKFVAQ